MNLFQRKIDWKFQSLFLDTLYVQTDAWIEALERKNLDFTIFWVDFNYFKIFYWNLLVMELK